MKFVAFAIAVLISTDVIACGNKNYELQTELQVNEKVYTSKFQAQDGETAVNRTSGSEGETTVQVLASEAWDEKHQGDAVHLRVKVLQNQGRRSLLAENFEIIARYGEEAEMTITPNKLTSTAKSLRFKVTAKKL